MKIFSHGSISFLHMVQLARFLQTHNLNQADDEIKQTIRAGWRNRNILKPWVKNRLSQSWEQKGRIGNTLDVEIIAQWNLQGKREFPPHTCSEMGAAAVGVAGFSFGWPWYLGNRAFINGNQSSSQDKQIQKSHPEWGEHRGNYSVTSRKLLRSLESMLPLHAVCAAEAACLPHSVWHCTVIQSIHTYSSTLL